MFSRALRNLSALLVGLALTTAPAVDASSKAPLSKKPSAARGSSPAVSPPSVFAEEGTGEGPAEQSQNEEEGEKDKKKDEDKEFTEVVENFEVFEGLFTLYRNPEDNKVFLAIKPEQLDRTFVCNVARDAGDGRFFDSGTMAMSFPFVFEKVGKKIRFVHENVYYRADPTAPIAGAIQRGLSNSLVGSAKLEAKPHPEDGRLLVDPTGFFVKDMLGVTQTLKEGPELEYSFDKDESYFDALHSFPFNTEIEVVAQFTSGKRRAVNRRIPDSRSFEHRYRYSLIDLEELTDRQYVPRLADDRVGYFLTMFQDYSELKRETPYTWYIERWNLQKENPGEKLSRPKKPIVFWLENTIPHEYRDAIREGALLWNDAFERVGFKDAIVVKQMPDDAPWDPADVRYNVIRWIVMPGGGYAVGPSHASPFTGEIFAADIRISADFIRYFFRSYEEYVDPLAAYADVGDPNFHPAQIHSCNYSRGKSYEAAFGIDLMTAREFVDPDSPELKKYIHDGLVDLVAHEVGHTLGLRHNFRGSTIHELGQLHDRSLTEKEGVSGSVMDYNPVNVAPKGGKQGSFWCTNLGTYDYWVLEYGYTPLSAKAPEEETQELLKIASRGSSDTKLPYGTDEDAFGFSMQGVDPLTNLWDYGPDPIAFYEQRFDLADEILQNMEDTFAKPGARYQKMRLVFGRAMRQYWVGAATVAKHVGGLYFYRDHVGDPKDRLPFQPVPTSRQRRALDFINERIFAKDAFRFSESLVNKLAPERLYDFDWTIYYQPRVDYPIHGHVLGIQRAALDRLFHPITLNRLLDYPLHSNGDALSMHELFDKVTNTIWGEVADGAGVGSFRRNLQREHLDKMIALVVKPSGAPYYTPFSGKEPAGHIAPPEDARSCARANLAELAGRIDSALEGDVNAETRAHLDESRARIGAALEAALQRGM